MANGQENLIPSSKRSKDEARENGRKGGIASGEVRRRKRDLKKRLQLLLEMEADPRVAAALSKTGVEVNDNLDVLMAGIMKGVIKGDPKSINLLIELSGSSVQEKDQQAIRRLEKRKAKLEVERAEMENELYKMRLNAIKGIGQAELPDDGFLDALKETAAEDWENDV